MNVPYTYYLVHKPTGLKYYGVRFAKNCHPSDLWNKYFTSSKKVHKLIEEYGINSFAVEVRKTFKSKQEAIKYETKVLQRLNVIHRKDWINESQGRANLNNVTKGMLGKTHRLETIEKMKQNNAMNKPEHIAKVKTSKQGIRHLSKGEDKRMAVPGTEKFKKLIDEGFVVGQGHKMSEKTKHKISQLKKGKPFSGYNSNTPESIEKRRQKMIGKKRTPESREKMRQARLNYLNKNKTTTN